jgi:hypothetical protein
MNGKDFAIAAILLLVAFCAGYFLAPEYINLQDVERAGYDAQIASLNTNHKAEIDGWLRFADDCNAYADTIHNQEEAACIVRVANTADRMAEKNQELIEINDDWQDLFGDMNKSMADLNNAIADLNCGR